MSGINNFRGILKQVFHENIVPVSDTVYPLKQARKGYAHYKRGEQFGENVLKLLIDQSAIAGFSTGIVSPDFR